jgi:hypothetical protein
MEEFDYELIHRAGKQHGNADAMSRRPCRLKECLCAVVNETQSCEAGVNGVTVRAAKQTLPVPVLVPIVSCPTEVNHSQPADNEILEGHAVDSENYNQGVTDWSDPPGQTREKTKSRVRLLEKASDNEFMKQRNDQRAAAVNDIGIGNDREAETGVDNAQIEKQRNGQRAAVVLEADANDCRGAEVRSECGNTEMLRML